MSKKNTRENYTRVTNILYPFSGLSNIDPYIVEHAAKRGTKVHEICEGIISGIGEHNVDDETRGYVESFKKWWEKGHNVLMMEQRFWCDDLKITGQIDLILDTPEGLSIVDLKTSSKPSKTWKAQGSAYAYLARKNNVDVKKIYFLHLNKYGKVPKIYEYPVDDDFFFEIYRVWDYFFK